jgi:hypothetical protein
MDFQFPASLDERRFFASVPCGLMMMMAAAAVRLVLPARVSSPSSPSLVLFAADGRFHTPTIA